jgi:hypothetical protein
VAVPALAILSVVLLDLPVITTGRSPPIERLAIHNFH